MPRTQRTADDAAVITVTKLYPTPDYHIPGVPAAELHLPSEVADVLLAFRPAAFTTTRPEGWKDAKQPITSLDGYDVPALRPPPDPEPPTDGAAAPDEPEA